MQQLSLYKAKQLPKRIKAPTKYFKLTDIVLFGKYKRQTIQAIAIQDPEYLSYMHQKGIIILTSESLDYVQKINYYAK